MHPDLDALHSSESIRNSLLRCSKILQLTPRTTTGNVSCPQQRHRVVQVTKSRSPPDHVWFFSLPSWRRRRKIPLAAGCLRNLSLMASVRNYSNRPVILVYMFWAGLPEYSIFLSDSRIYTADKCFWDRPPHCAEPMRSDCTSFRQSSYAFGRCPVRFDRNTHYSWMSPATLTRGAH